MDAQVDSGGYGSTSEFIRDLIRREQDRQRLRTLLLNGAASAAGPIADNAYFSSSRDRLRTHGFVAREAVLDAFSYAPAIDAARFRNDLDRDLDQDIEPRA